MAITSFNTENRTYRQLLGNGLTYHIPSFQRDYSWTELEWEELWQDLLATLSEEEESAHYMGYLVLQSTNSRLFEVIDGQQRLTTISLIVLAAMRLLQKNIRSGKNAENDQRRLDQLRNTYIGYLDPVSLVARNKLKLNRHNDPYYRNYLVPLTDSLPRRGFPASTHSMRKAFEWFEKRLNEHVKGDVDTGLALTKFVDAMSDKLFFTVITVSDEINAYKVFETLNARGVRLSTTDLLKNYLFSILARGEESEQELEALEQRWESIVDRLGSEGFPDFLRMHWNSRHAFARQAELFKVLRHSIKDREEVFTLLRQMDEDLDAYLALTQPEASGWADRAKGHLFELRMFSVRQPYPMLMAARRHFTDGDFESLLRATVVISFRFNVIGSQQAGEQERVYHQVAQRIERKEITRLGQAIESLRAVYPSDDEFRSNFANKSIKSKQNRNGKIIRYILNRLERQMGGVDFDADAPTYTIEHVLPRNPGAGWEAFNDRDLDSFVDRLANMLMLENSLNRAIGNSSYAEKRPVLQSSALRVTSGLAEENADWTPERLDNRQRQLANLATTIWRIAQLS